LYKSVTKDWGSFFNFIRSLWDARRREELDRALVNEVAQHYVSEPMPEQPVRVSYFPWRSLLAFFLALGAQSLLEPQNRQTNIAVVLYVLAAGVCIWAYFKNEWHLPALPVTWQTSDDLSTRTIPFLLSIVLALTAFWFFGGGVFTLVNVLLWLLAIGFLFWGLWVKRPKIEQKIILKHAQNVMERACFSVFAVMISFACTIDSNLLNVQRSCRKILDIHGPQGEYKIFFRAIPAVKLFKCIGLCLSPMLHGASFLSPKLGSAVDFDNSVVYLLKEYGGSRVGLFALVLGIAYWPNVISRIGLLPLYPLSLRQRSFI
jgi:hypothetical protein